MKPLDFFNSVQQRFLAALSQERQFFYRLAQFTFCLRFAGDSLIDSLTPALEHLRIDPLEECDLTICIWDSASTHTDPIAFPWPQNAHAVRGETLGYSDERIHTVAGDATKALHLFDKERRLALYWIQDAKQLPWWVAGSPLLQIFHWWMDLRGHQLTHAAAVGHPQGGVLLSGKSGSGKSTTALACMKAGMHYVSEDYCVIRNRPDIWAYSLFNSAKIQEKTLSWFPELSRQVENKERPREDKAFFFHHKFQPERVLHGFPLKALIALQVGKNKESRLEAVPPQEVIAPLIGSTLWQLTHTSPATVAYLKSVAEALPCYKLHLGHDLAEPPKLIEALL